MNAHIDYTLTHTRNYTNTTHDQLIQSYAYLFFKCWSAFQKKRKLTKLLTKSTYIIIFVKEENKLDYKVHLSISYCKLLFLVQIYFSISYLLFTLTRKLSMLGSSSFLLQLHRYIFHISLR